MVRTAFADEHHFAYFAEVSKQNPYTIGLILGQTAAGKDYIIHFAKTPPLQSGDNKTVAVLSSIGDINGNLVVDHARQAARTLPGGMHVLGMFIVGAEDLLNPFSSKVKSILDQTHKQLDSNVYLYANYSNEKLVLNYCTSTKQITCKSFDVVTGSVKPAELKFVQEMRWTQVECKYQMEQSHHISEKETDWPLKKHMGIVLDRLNLILKHSIFLYDGELRLDDENIETVGKKKMTRSHKNSSQDPNKPIQVSILQPCESAGVNKFEISSTGNEIRIFGHIVSKLWLNPKVSVTQANEAIKQDILRSLSTRLELHWDSLIEEEQSEDMNSVHEPPRRVLVPLPNSNITMSDYLFPGEGPQDAQASLEETLDIKIQNQTDVIDVEGQADLNEYYNEAVAESESEEAVSKSTKQPNKMYFMGLAVGIFVLILSLLIHLMQRN